MYKIFLFVAYLLISHCKTITKERKYQKPNILLACTSAVIGAGCICGIVLAVVKYRRGRNVSELRNIEHVEYVYE